MSRIEVYAGSARLIAQAWRLHVPHFTNNIRGLRSTRVDYTVACVLPFLNRDYLSTSLDTLYATAMPVGLPALQPQRGRLVFRIVLDQSTNASSVGDRAIRVRSWNEISVKKLERVAVEGDGILRDDPNRLAKFGPSPFQVLSEDT